MQPKNVDKEFINKLYSNLSILCDKYPDVFQMNISPILFSITDKANVFSMYAGELGFVDLITFHPVPDFYLDEVILDYKQYSFINFFNRLDYIELVANISSGSNLVWLASWAEFLFWNLQQGSESKTQYSRDVYDLTWLANENISRGDKLNLLTNGLYLKQDVLQFKDLPKPYVKAFTNVPDLETILFLYRSRSTSLPI